MTMSLLKEKDNAPAEKKVQGDLVIFIGARRLAGFLGSTAGSSPKIARHVIQKNPEGFEGGLVTDLERAAHSLEQLVKELTGVTGEDDVQITASVVLSNAKLKTFAFASSQYYQGNQRTITAQEISSVVEQTRTVATLPLTEFVLQAVPQSFLVNDIAGVRNPLGLEAHRLGVEVKMHTMNFEDFKNITRAFEAAEIEVEGYFPKTMTVAEAVLLEEEKEEGALLADVAEDHVELVLYKEGRLVDSQIIPGGAKSLYENIAAEWGIAPRDAARVQQEYGSLAPGDFSGELIPLVERNGKNNVPIKRAEFQRKYTEFFRNWVAGLLQQAEAFGKENKIFHPHLVFTGDLVQIDGFVEFLAQQFTHTARTGQSRKVDAVSELVLDPYMVPALGMYRWMSQQLPDQKKLAAPKGFIQKTLATARDWFFAYF